MFSFCGEVWVLLLLKKEKMSEKKKNKKSVRTCKFLYTNKVNHQFVPSFQKEEIAKEFDLPERKSKIATIMKQDGQAYCICRSSDCSRFMM